VRKIFDYYKKFGHETIVMGASFRSVGEVRPTVPCIEALPLFPIIAAFSVF
jgi:hypothetical protein